jgi:RHS repeat-associated protein
LDKESGYYFYNARHYDPEIARFVTADTVIDGELSTQGWNRFAYVHNNPIIYKDPTGHFSDKAIYTASYENKTDKVAVGVQTEKIDQGDKLSQLVERRVKDLSNKGIKSNYKTEMSNILKWNSQIKDPNSIKTGDRLITDVAKIKSTTPFGKSLEALPNLEHTLSTTISGKNKSTDLGGGTTFSLNGKIDPDKGVSYTFDIGLTGGYSPDNRLSATAGVSFGDGASKGSLTANYRNFVGDIDISKNRTALKIGVSTDPYGLTANIPVYSRTIANAEPRKAMMGVLDAQADKFVESIQKYKLKEK